MKLLIASGNKHKIYEFRVLFEKYKDIEVLSLADLDDHDEVEENGTTFSENAFIKAKYFYDKYKIITISDDSGIVVPSTIVFPVVLAVVPPFIDTFPISVV